MPCYSYLSGYPISFNNNIEVVIAVGSPYTYDSIAWVCEFPVNDQLKVYKRATIGGTDILLIETTHYTINTTASTITFGAGVLTGMEQVVIRRKTPDTRMITRFVDGAKLKAKDLNSCFHQLLFLNQEKEFLPATINHYHSIPSAMPAWTTPFTYTVGSIVQNAGLIYRCILTTTQNQITTNTTYWTQVTPSQNGFVLIGGPSPVAFDFTNLSIGNAIIWDGAKFISNPFTGALASLTDVSTSGAVTGDVLIYNGGAGNNPPNSKWNKASPSFNMELDQLILKNHVFYLNPTTTSYNTVSPLNVSTKSFLSGFKDVSNRWVLTDAPTVYHIIQKTITIDGEIDPRDFFSNITNSLTGLAANITNPIKVKFTWDLSYGVLDQFNNTGSVNSESLIGLKATFWDAPGELYSPTGYGIGSTLLYHGVRNTTIKYRNSPFYNRSALVANPGTQQTYSSKMFGYGVSNFYLSVPECRTSVFHMLPIITSSNLYFNLTNLTQAALITSVNLVGNQSAATYRDYYLLNLRDMAFASNRSDITSYGITASVEDYRNRDSYARRFKGLLICADYDGIDNVYFKRLETGENPLYVLWKIPRNIIYYNKAAIALSFKGNSRLLTSGGEFDATLNRMVRFTGYSELHADPSTNYGDSTTTAVGQGIYFKADKLWTEWCQRWTGSTDGDYRFNEADIDWVCSGFSGNSSSIKLFTTTYYYFPLSTVAPQSAATNSNDVFPWAYRPNDIQIPYDGTDQTGHIGTHPLNIDANKLFSEAHNFVPDPTDEYVFRLVVNPTKNIYFFSAGIDRIKSSIILEYGFSDDNARSSTNVRTTLSGAFPETILRAGPMKSVARLDKSNVFVYIKREHIEQVNGVDRYIITLAIRVPRAKSIGYSKVFRAFSSVTPTVFPIRGVSTDTGNASNDTWIDSGPWGFGGFNTVQTNPESTSSGWWDDGNGQSSTYLTREALIKWGPDYNPTKDIATSGRNECAVKFTRIGIPSTLWIRLSVLNTDGEAELINNAGWI